MSLEIFLSYAHQDEWLKNEFTQHLSALKRSGTISVWHDRCITPGEGLNSTISKNIESADVVILLISPAFIASSYCMDIEFKRAMVRKERDGIQIVPIIIRECDWDVYGLRDFLALPTDSQAVTRGAGSKEDSQQRDAKWLDVVHGLKRVIEAQKKKLEPPRLAKEYLDTLHKVKFIKHPSMSEFDERIVFVEPEVYFEKERQRISSISNLVGKIADAKAAIIFGPDRAGKSLIAKVVQTNLDSILNPSIIIHGSEIGSLDIDSIIRRSVKKQLATIDFRKSSITIIIDDFDDCRLGDATKEKIIRTICEGYCRILIFSFSSAPAVFFSPNDLPDPISLNIQPLSDSKVYELVKKWKLALDKGEAPGANIEYTDTFEKIMLIFQQTEILKYPFNVVTFLELLDSAVGTDIAPSSFAACYEALIQNRLLRAGCDHRQIDEQKNFLSLIAYRAFQETQGVSLSQDSMDRCLTIFSEQYLSDREDLIKLAVSCFLIKSHKKYSFSEDYIFYFLCARYVGKSLVVNDREKYIEFVSLGVQNVFQKKYANIIIYLAYFTTDNLILVKLKEVLDQLFEKATDWKLSDKTRPIMLGIAKEDGLSISGHSDVESNRVELLASKVSDIVEDAEQVVAKYTLPFLDPYIEDSELLSNIGAEEISGDSYIRSVNALLRIHSVIGHILNSRPGTYNADIVLSCIEKMVQASGRYASLNHAIATLLIFDKERAIESTRSVFHSDTLTDEERYEKVMRIFSFWSVFLSQTGLARYLAQPHSIRALQALADEREAKKSEDGFIPYNYTSGHLEEPIAWSGLS